MKRLLIICALLVLLPGCKVDITRLADDFRTAKTAIVGVDDGEEAAIGHEAAATLLGASPLLADENMQHYVNRVGRWVTMHSARPDIHWRFAIIDNANINAFAAPGGYVFITRGLLLQLQSEAELAGVLGHEIAHVVEKHHLNALQKDARLKLAGRVAEETLAQRGHNPDQYAWVVNGAKTLYTRGLDRDDEFAADRLGVVLAARAGYDPYGLPSVLQTLDSLKGEDSRLALLFKTHPEPSARMDELVVRMAGRMDAITGKTGEARFRQQVQVLAKN